jgi:hypothetical protein
MTLRNIFTVTFLLFLFHLQGQNCRTSVANNFIAKLFQNKSYNLTDKIKFLSFSADQTELLDLPFLKTLLPNYCFYTTEFQSNQYEYINVETAIALRVDSPNQSIITHSPLFYENKNFIQLFYGLKIQDSLMRVKLCKEVMTIFSSINNKGHINSLSNLKNKKSISFELVHDNRRWEVYDFIFENNSLTEIVIRMLGRDQIKTDYKQI